jgi:2-polyprenyl-6-methoxyphenol hydroxylase-like FAD-dependent oxidoreductase
VVGGGATGSAAAAALARCGLEVVLLEQLGPDADPDRNDAAGRGGRA